MTKHSEYFLSLQRSKALREHPLFFLIRRKWMGVKARASKVPSRPQAYEGVTLNPEWQNLENFADWFLAQPGHTEPWELDKDILVPGNRQYGPLVCVLVPSWVNTAFVFRPRGSLPRGVQYRSRNRVMASISQEGKTIRLGTFQDPMQAHRAWQAAKADSLDALAVRYDNERPSCFRDDVLKAIRRRATNIRLDIIHGRETLNF